MKKYHLRFLSLVGALIIIFSVWQLSAAEKTGSDGNLVSPGTCTDSDNGNDSAVRGTTCSGSSCAVDACRSGNILNELTCDDGQIKTEAVTCANGNCLDGKCVAPKPNILLIMADDQDWELHGFMGHPTIGTDSLDNLAREGTLLPNALTTMGRCRPALASTISGQFPHQNGVFDNHASLPLSTVNALPELLLEAGYATFGGGKWWENSPSAYGFESFTDLGAGFVREPNGHDDLFAFLDGVASSSQPFFVWYAPNLPHLPHTPPAEYLDSFDEADIIIPSNISEADQSEFIAYSKEFYATVRWFDDKISEVLEHLEQIGELDNTVVIYMVDNGYAYGYVSKGSPYEKGIKSPIIIHDPRRTLPAPKVLKPVVSIVDLPATILDYAGVAQPPSYAGKSLRPMLEINARETRSPLTEGIYSGSLAFSTTTPYQIENAIYAIISKHDQGKYVRYLKDISANGGPSGIAAYFVSLPFTRLAGTEEFYNLATDPYELSNQIANPTYASKIEELRNASIQFEGTYFSPNNPPSSTNTGQRKSGKSEEVFVNNTELIAIRPQCLYNQEYSSTTACECRGQTPHWSAFRHENQSCTPDQKTVFICRDTVVDITNQKSVIPREVMVHLKAGVTQSEVESAVNATGAKIRTEPCSWPTINDYQTLVVETAAGAEASTAQALISAGVARKAYPMPQMVCTTDKP